MRRIFLYLVLGVIFPAFFLSKPVFAECFFRSSSDVQSALNLTMPLNVSNITVGNEIPDGTVVSRQFFKPDFSLVDIECPENAPGNYHVYTKYSRTPLGLSSWGGSPYGGQVYETGVPGIGVVISRAEATPPFDSGIGGNCARTNNCEAGTIFFDFDIMLIKTGKVSAGMVSGGNLPCISTDFGQEGGDSVHVLDVCISGSLNVVSSTCKTPDVTVPMGTYETRQFTGKGSAGKWVDASIHLTNCPVFHGIMGDESYRDTYWSPDGSTGIGKYTNNSLGVKFVPVTDVLDSQNGIFSLYNKEDRSGQATGVGVQLAYGTTGSQDKFISFGEENKYVMERESSSEVTIPLVARYVQTSDVVTPGTANSAVTFIINYY